MAGSTLAFVDVPAKTWRLLVSSVLGFIIIALVIAAVTFWGLAGSLPRTLAMSLNVLAMIVLTVIWQRLRTRRGMNPGHLLLGLCPVDPMTGLPDRLPSLCAVDIRRGQDPLCPGLRSLVLDTTTPRRPPVDVTLIVSLDDGSNYRLDTPCVIRRDPRVAPPYHYLAATDISRTISRAHLALWSESGLLLLSDTGSRGGTAIITTQEDHPLSVDQIISLPMAPGLLTHLRLGQRELRIEVPSNLPGAR